MTDKIWSTGPLESDKNSSSKFYSKSLTLLVRIFELVKEGTIAADIASRLNMKKSHISYYITKARNMFNLSQDEFIVRRSPLLLPQEPCSHHLMTLLMTVTPCISLVVHAA